MFKCRPIQCIEYLTESVVSDVPATAYYTDSDGEPPAEWWCPSSWIAPDGEFASALAVIRLGQGRHPDTGRTLISRNARAKRMGFDATFSPPKAFGTLWGVSPPQERDRLDHMLTTSVRGTLSWILESGFLEARRRIGGRKAALTREPMKHAVAALFRHSTNREGDPHPHVHAALMMPGLREDGVIAAINNERLLEAQMIVGAAFRLRLATLLERAGVPVVADRLQGFRIIGLPASLSARWSKRRIVVVTEAARRGMLSTRGHAKEAERISLATRGSKVDLPARDQLEARWRGEAAESGWIPGAEWSSLNRWPIMRAAKEERAAAAEVVATAIEWHTERSSLFSRSDIEALALTLAVGRASQQAVHDRIEPALFDGDIIDAGQYRLLTTHQTVREEREIVALTRRHLGNGSLVFTTAASRAAMADAGLNDTLPMAIEHALSTSTVAVTKSGPGIGKAALMDALARACAVDRRRFIVAVPPGNATESSDPQPEVDLAVFRAGKLRKKLERGKVTLRPSDVVFLEEACAFGRRQILGLMRRVVRAGAMVRVHRAPKPLLPAGRSDPLALISRAIAGPEIAQIKRQKVEWQRQASMTARAGRIEQALRRYADHGAVSVAADARSALDAAVAAFRDVRGDATAIAWDQATVCLLNVALRAEAAALGILNGPEIVIQSLPCGRQNAASSSVKLALRRGDRLILGADATVAGVGLRYGSRLTIVEVIAAGSQLQLEAADGRQILATPADLERGGRGEKRPRPIVMQHAYAVSPLASQDATWGRTIWLPSREDRRSALAAMTRHVVAMEVIIDRSRLPAAVASRIFAQAVRTRDPERAVEGHRDAEIIAAVGRSMERVHEPCSTVDLLGEPASGTIVPIPPGYRYGAGSARIHRLLRSRPGSEAAQVNSNVPVGPMFAPQPGGEG